MFDKHTISFLQELSTNNNRDWFHANKQRYEEQVRTPALEFIELMEPAIKRVSPYLDCTAKKVGGALMRVHRDTRFGNDKTPYKTNIGIHFRHVRGKDVHSPGYYLHIEPGEVYLGAGIWKPDSPHLKAIRLLIDEHPKEWRALKKKVLGNGAFSLSGDSLKTAPRGYSPEHPAIEDLRRRDFIALMQLPPEAIHDKNFHKLIGKQIKSTAPLMKFLCDANDLMF
ncbi:DUF2461 domain-containing protein [Granulosicoccus antarcticus]|uniref:TIGR02453 family protein n=1 Tax=Granulosicoccus antarcticus IMCC3135 TaxID=1192854 RepID=A0A2Z2NNM0_9GAMM|nr:DUF2461 domain-containing protein [Granulosicoccus antarcticus]ASJ71531.1 hypothetical protein IMCC3135_07125 [Granulosicoccus antarcticus IMCC3135]